MSKKITDPRFAHSEGYTALSFGSNGQFVVTGGTDSLLRVFHAHRTERDQEAITIEQHSDSVLCISTSQSKIISGDEEGMTFGFDTSTNDTSNTATTSGLSVEPSGTILRSVLPARDISISSSEKQVAIANDDENVRIVSLLDTAVLHTLQGHRGPVNSVCFSPDSVYLASSGSDGTVRIWDLRDDDPGCIKIFPKFSYTCEPGNNIEQFKIRWSPDGRFLAVPGPDHGIKLIERNTWEPIAELSGIHTKMVVCISWSSNSKYVASVGLDNLVSVWDVSARKSILSHTNENTLCQVDWNPRSNMLAFSDNTGAMYIWDDVVPVDSGNASPFDRHLAGVESGALVNANEPSNGSGEDNALMSELFDDNAAEARDGDENDDEIADEEGVLDAGDETGDLLDDFVVDDDGAGYAEYSNDQSRWRMGMAMLNQETQCFQPGSTPWVDSRRYLSFNMVGTITSIAQDEVHNTIEISFYDKSIHRDIHFSDSYKFSLAALSDSGCLLATTTKELANDNSLRANNSHQSDGTSVISYRAFSSWSTSSDWTLKLPHKEHPKCIAVSSHGAAVITSSGILRLFTCGGAQHYIESLPNRVVTCVAHSDMLLIVFESPGTLRGLPSTKQVEYDYILMSMDGQSRFATGACPVTPTSEVVWAGFSEEGHPAICDSLGMLRVLHRYWDSQSASWVPILDTRAISREHGKKRGEAYWPVAVSARQFIVAICRNKNKYPSFPPPILEELNVEIPLLQRDTMIGQQETKLLGERLFFEQQCGEAQRTNKEYPGGAAAQARDEFEQDKLILKLIQIACKADRAQRAMDLAMMIGKEQSFDAAIKIAVFQKHSALAERLVRQKEIQFPRAELLESDIEAEYDGGDNDLRHSNGQRSKAQHSGTNLLNSRRRKPAVTYGKQDSRMQEDSDRRNLSDNEDANDSYNMNRGDDIDDDEFVNGKPLLQDGVLPLRDYSKGENNLVARPPPKALSSKIINPFGVNDPCKSMDIKRTDSFFNAMDSLDKDDTTAQSSASASIKRGSSDVEMDDGESETAAPRKQAKKDAAGRAQSKISAFAFKINSSKGNKGNSDS